MIVNRIIILHLPPKSKINYNEKSSNSIFFNDIVGILYPG